MSQRRRLLLAAAALPLVPACTPGDVQGFATWADATRALQALGPQARTRGGWPLAQVLEHAAQSIEYSIDGYPVLKSALFRGTVGAAAWALFDARGRMNHALDEPIPGAPALTLAFEAARERLLSAMSRYAAHGGPLAPHFAYGPLDKAQYARAHLMHLANHWTEVQPAGAPR